MLICVVAATINYHRDQSWKFRKGQHCDWDDLSGAGEFAEEWIVSVINQSPHPKHGMLIYLFTSYLKMISTAKEGGTIINYSDRFTITGMTGTTTNAIQQAVSALGGATAGPPTVNDVAAAAAPAAAPADTPAVGASIYNVPYGQQTGLTKYAPMQGVPPTQITLKKMTPLFPSSAWTVAKTYLPKATILTTLTEAMTFSVKSHANTVSPCSHLVDMELVEADYGPATGAISTDGRYGEVPREVEGLRVSGVGFEVYGRYVDIFCILWSTGRR